MQKKRCRGVYIAEGRTKQTTQRQQRDNKRKTTDNTTAGTHMTERQDQQERFSTIVHRYENMVKNIGANFYHPDTYLFRQIVVDLTTYLWLVFRNLPPGAVIHNEKAWIYTILYRKALNLVRSEKRYQQHLVYGSDLTTLPDNGSQDPMVSRLYNAIDKLNDSDRELILMYIDQIPIKEIAIHYDKSQHHVRRRIEKIKKTLRNINSQIDL